MHEKHAAICGVPALLDKKKVRRHDLKDELASKQIKQRQREMCGRRQEFSPAVQHWHFGLLPSQRAGNCAIHLKHLEVGGGIRRVSVRLCSSMTRMCCCLASCIGG